MSNQLRTIVENSVAAYHKFFLRYEKSPCIQFKDPDNRSLCSIKYPVWIPHTAMQPAYSGEEAPLPNNYPRPVFVQKLVVKKGQEGGLKIAYDISLQDMDRKIGEVFDNMVKALAGVPRVENKLFSFPDEAKHLQLNVEDAAATEIWARKKQVEAVLGRSVRDAAMLHGLYDEFAYLLDEDTRVKQWLQSARSLSEYKEQVALCS